MAKSQDQAEWRERKRRGQMKVPVVVGEETVDALVRRGKLREEDRRNRKAIGAAISRLRFRIVDDDEM
jgi:hypothetical protein